MSSAIGYSGDNSYVFFIDEIAGYGRGGYGGTLTSPAAPDGDDQHIPLNSLVSLDMELPKYGMYEAAYIGDSIRTRQSTILEPGTVTLDAVYHAPFLASRFFTKKQWDGTWSADPETITMDMTDWETTTNSIALFAHIENRDSSGDNLNITMYGGQITSYGWTIESEDVLKESVEMSYNQYTTTTTDISYNSDADYHNQKFALWNTDRILDDTSVLAIQQKKVSVTTTTDLDSAIASYSSAALTISTEYQSEVGIGYEQQNFSEKQVYDVEATMTAKIKDDYPISQFVSRFEDREKIHFTIKINETSYSHEEYLRCTNMRLESIGSVTIPDPSSDAVMQLELVFLPTSDSVVSYSGEFDGTNTATPEDASKMDYIKYLTT